jgi:hypothetical protein
MSTAHPRPWHWDSRFGDGPRRPLDREQRARFKFLLAAHYRSGHITAKFEKVGTALLQHLSYDGRCDPAHKVLAAEAGCSTKTVERALQAFKAIGLVLWQHRIGRDRWRVYQRSNAYVLCPGAVPNPPTEQASRRDRHFGEEKTLKIISTIVPVFSDEDRIAALAALADRRRVVLERMQTKDALA